MPQSSDSLRVPGIEHEYSRKKILVALMIPLAMSLIAVSMVNVALPTIQHSLGASDSSLQWILSGYALVFGITLVPAGRLGDIMGRSMLLVIGVFLFAVASLLCGLAHSVGTLNLYRLFQGIGAGMIGPQSMGIIQQYFQGKSRGRAFAAFGMVISVAVAIGPLLAGGTIQLLGPESGWRVAFLANVPVGVIALIIGFLWLPWGRERQFIAVLRRHRINTGQLDPKTHTKPDVPDVPGSQKSMRVDLDPVGMIMLMVAVICVMLPFMYSVHPAIWLLIPLAAVLFVCWYKWEKFYAARGHSPQVDLSLFHHSSYVNGTAVSGTFFLGSTSIFVITAMFMQNGLHQSALVAGTIGLPTAIVSGIVAMFVGSYVYDYGRRIIIACLLSIAIGILGFALVAFLISSHGISYWWLMVPGVILGIGQGGMGSANQTTTLSEVPPRMGGAAGGVKQTAERVGTAVGNAVITAITFFFVGQLGWNGAYMCGLVAIVFFVLVSLALASYDLRVNGAGGGPKPGRKATQQK